jgi:hypothetical protein
VIAEFVCSIFYTFQKICIFFQKKHNFSFLLPRNKPIHFIQNELHKRTHFDIFEHISAHLSLNTPTTLQETDQNFVYSLIYFLIQVIMKQAAIVTKKLGEKLTQLKESAGVL